MIEYKQNTSSIEDIFIHLSECSDSFIPKLNTYVDIKEYSNKLFNKSYRFEAYDDNVLIGLICLYTDNQFITNVSSIPKYHGKKSIHNLMKQCINFCNKGKIQLEVNKDNNRAINFYKKYGFDIAQERNKNYCMELIIERNYNREFKDTSERKYAYNFDFDIMHPYMIKSFEPFFKGDDVLELGSFKGDFTKRLTPFFNDITCVEASDEAIQVAIEKLSEYNVNFYNSLFEETQLPKKYNNIIITHVLEHIDCPITFLNLVKEKWLTDDGKIFVVCPNANAPSRQIAVKMGLISHNSAITHDEREHGHRVTYSLDTLERDIKSAGLKPYHRGGIFFKALANFQWDMLLNSDIITKEYLDGCYQLGQQYPDLCSSIMIICKK